MYLTDHEQAMLDGAYGPLKQQAMVKIVEYARIVDAPRLCQVSMAHVFCGYHQYLDVMESSDFDRVTAQMHFCTDAPLHVDAVDDDCICQSDVGPMCPEQWQSMGVPAGRAGLNRHFLERYAACGINLVGTCVPYLCGFVPMPGQHYVSSESHAVVLLNAHWGAYGHADGLEAGFWSAVCGRTPLWGLHTPEGRYATHLVRLEAPVCSLAEWDLFGHALGRLLPAQSIPAFAAPFTRPDITRLKAAYASMATTSGVEMAHWEGFTPEAPSLRAAFGPRPIPGDAIVLTQRELDDSRAMLGAHDDTAVDFISLGCPHYTLDQLRRAAAWLEGKRVHSGVHLELWTAAPIKHSADACGCTARLERAGAKVFTSSCPLTSDRFPHEGGVLAFDSAKQAHYITPLTRGRIVYGSMEDCLIAAVSGRWQRGGAS